LTRAASSPRRETRRAGRGIESSYVQGSAATLSEVDSLGVELDDYDLFHATRADLLRALGRTGQVTDADRRALTLTANPAGQSLLRQRLTWD